ncbi:MAG: protease PrsW [Actinomycetota bacterium]|nr:protease PrsW [Actinomycetota bacterium]
MSTALRSRPPIRLTHRSFVQVDSPAFWLFVVLLVTTGFVTWSEQRVFQQLSPSGWALSWGLVLLYALPVCALVYVLDLYEREPASVLLAAVLWGGVIATTLAGYANEGWGSVVSRVGGPAFAARWTAALTAPIVEETLKGLGVVVIFLVVREEIDDAMDGFVYGALVGLGFAVVEDVFYFMAVFGGKPAGVLQGFFLRVVAGGLYSHVLYTGLVGMGIGYAVERRDAASRRRRAAVLAGLAAVAALAHFIWNSPFLDLFPAEPWHGADWLQVVVATSVKGLPFLGFLIVAVRLARRRERRWLTGVLAEEVADEGISPWELEILLSPGRRRQARRDMRRRGGSRAASVLHRLQREQVNLGMIRARVADEEDPALLQQRALCRSLRMALEAMPGAASARTGRPAG